MVTKFTLNCISQNTINNLSQKIIAIDYLNNEIVIEIESLKKEIVSIEPPIVPTFFIDNTAIINKSNPILKVLIESIDLHETNTKSLVNQIIKYIFENYSYCKDYENKIMMTFNLDDSLEYILSNKKGTCSEFSHLAIGILRSFNIPCKFISGIIINDNSLCSHTLIEAFIEGEGWLSADPLSGTIGKNENYIKLYEGRDFNDILPCLIGFNSRIV